MSDMQPVIRRSTYTSEQTIMVMDPFARRLITHYLKRRDGELKMLRQSLVDGDFCTITETAHKLCGSGSAYGLDEVTQLGCQLELAGQREDTNAVAALLDALEIYLRQVKLT